MFSNLVFLLGGTIALIGALIHFVVAPASVSWYTFFGALIEVIKLRQEHSLWAPVLSIMIGLLMLVCALFLLRSWIIFTTAFSERGHGYNISCMYGSWAVSAI